MSQVKFVDGSIYEISDERGSYNEIPINVSSMEEISSILNKMTDANLSEIQIISDSEILEIYKNQHFDHANIEGLKLSIFFTPLDETTIRLNELDQALVELANLIVGEE